MLPSSFPPHELQKIVAEARAWLDSGAPFGLPAEAALSLSPLAEGYAEGVIAERLRGREQRDLACRLARAIEAYRDFLTDIHKPPLVDTSYPVDMSNLLIGEARKAGLLDGGEK